MRELSRRPFASSSCPCAWSSQQHRPRHHPLASGFGSMQGLTAILPTSQCTPFPGLSFGKHVRLCIKHAFHMSHGSIHSIRKIATLPNTTRATRQWEPCYFVHDGLHTTRQPCLLVASTMIQPVGIPSHLTGYHHTLSSPPHLYPTPPKWI